MIDENVCNMPNLATIEIHKHNDRYYLNFIAHEEIAEELGVEKGLWTDTEAVSDKIIAEIINAICKTDYEERESIIGSNTKIKLSELREMNKK